MIVAHIARQGDGSLRIQLTADRQSTDAFRRAVDAIKIYVPPASRFYLAPYKAWAVDAAHANLIRNVLRSIVDLVIDGDTPPDSPTASALDPSYSVLHLLPSAPPELVRSAYRCLALLDHPDRAGGDGESMRALNAAYEDLQARGAA